jgi:tetratricopeptide (TPR) repeat protein
VCGTPPFKGAGGIKKDLSQTSNLSFLTARAHYINGVGYYERDSIVPACAEYLKALELMESRFDEKDLVGKKARFMTYTYNRLGDMFSEQYMTEPALDCYRHSYDYSVISPVSSYSVSNALYRIGKQYNKKGDKDSADYYYTQASMNMPDSTNLYYRDLVSTKALLSYQMTHQAEISLDQLKQMAGLAEDDDERLTRYMVIGNIFFEEGMYDSALLYLEPVLENKRNRFLQVKIRLSNTTE